MTSIASSCLANRVGPNESGEYGECDVFDKGVFQERSFSQSANFSIAQLQQSSRLSSVSGQVPPENRD
jgi:hypothetical protein